MTDAVEVLRIDSLEDERLDAYVRLTERELRCVLEWSNKDIARRLSLSENAVAVRLMRGKALLQNKLEQEGYGREGFGI